MILYSTLGEWCVSNTGQTLTGCSYSFSSLYTLFQDNECFFQQSPQKRHSTMDASLGHAQAKLAKSGAVFFKTVKDHLVEEFNRDIDATTQANPETSYAVVVAGEAATHPEFLTAVTQAIDEVVGTTKRKVGQVKILDGYAAALGTADWMRRAMDHGYCAENPIVEERDNDIRRKRVDRSSDSDAASSVVKADGRDEL